MSEKDIPSKSKIICEKLDELINLMLTHDLNNVGMAWPGDVHRAGILRKMKDAYSAKDDSNGN